MFALIPFALANWRLLAIAGAVAGLVGAGFYVRHSLIAEGERTALEKIEKANVEAMSRANAASATLSQCSASLGVWDRSTGVCVHPAR